ncbi:unnamed protein product [Effrenium voratum]|nr:unnamed protein product [Effrenium voratum]
MALKLLALLHLISLRLAASGALTRHTGPAAAEAFSARRLAGETQFGTSQVFHAEPPWRDPSAAVRRDSLSLKWALDPSVLTVELQHDKGFGGDFLATVPIRAEYTRYQLNGLRVGGTYRFRLRAETAAGWGVWSPEAALRAVEPPSAPSGLHAVWHPQALRPQLCWAAPEDLGGANGADGADLVVQLYRVWLHMDGHVRLLATLDRTDRTCWEVDVPQLFSESLVLSVSAANQDFDGPKSETLELLTTGPPGQPGAPVLENSTAGGRSSRRRRRSLEPGRG